MAEDLYDEDLDQPVAATTDPREESKNEKLDSQTALVPKAALMGKAPGVGDRVTFEVTGIFEDEYELRCVYDDKKKALPDESEAETDLLEE